MSYTPAPSITDVLTNLKQKITDPSNKSVPLTRKFYKTLLDETADELLLLPIERVIAGFEPMEDTDEMEINIEQLTHVLATYFNISETEVKQDIVNAIRADKQSDLRSSRLARYIGKLH